VNIFSGLAGLLVLRDALQSPPAQAVIVTPAPYVPHRSNFSSAPVETPDDRRDKRFAERNVLSLARDYLTLSPHNGWREAFLARIEDEGKRQAVLKAARHLEATGL
jgi:hypothetical protein